MDAKGVGAAPRPAAGRSSRFDIRVYAWLVGGCSRDFRNEFGEEMLEFARARFERARQAGGRARLRLWLELLRDLLATATTTRFQSFLLGVGPPLDPPPITDKEPLMETLLQDLKYALRGLAASPGFTLMALLLLGLGVGANTAMFSLVDSFLFRPHPWKDLDQLVWIYQDSDSGEPNSTSFPAYRDIASHQRLFSQAAAMIESRGAAQNATGVIRGITFSVVTSNWESLDSYC